MDSFVVNSNYNLHKILKVQVSRILNMIIKISDLTIKETIKCKKDFSCLDEKRKELCKVNHNVGNEVHFIECLDTESCSYMLSFGDSIICTCPVRKEIYNQYKI